MIFDDYKIKSIGGVSNHVINDAEYDLDMKFSDEFREYLANYGAVELDNKELFGLGIKGYRNIVNATLTEKDLSSGFPCGYCVVYNIGIDSVLILLGNDGCIYEYVPQRIKKIHNSFSQWIINEFLDVQIGG